MNDFTDEQLNRLCGLLIKSKRKGRMKSSDKEIFYTLNRELVKRKELANLSFDDCDSCKL